VNSMNTSNTADMDRKTLQEKFKIDYQRSNACPSVGKDAPRTITYGDAN